MKNTFIVYDKSNGKIQGSLSVVQPIEEVDDLLVSHKDNQLPIKVDVTTEPPTVIYQEVPLPDEQ